MAGPGGGPPRKSHTKSRKGCRTCKKRHIRCDETFPQCRNCTKHNCRCDYMDMPAAGEEPMKGTRPPDLMMSSELQNLLDNWRITGKSLLPELQTHEPVYWTRFSTIDLRLIHHIVTLSTDIHARGYGSCTAWASKMQTLISVALSHDFVMNALLALSASHLSWTTKNVDTENLAYHHRGVALKGLHEAIGSFSRNNSDAILAASMLLSWQATEWRSWASLQQGVSTVMNAMQPWAHESELARYLEGQRSVARARTPSTPTYGHARWSVPNEDFQGLERISTALHNLRLRLSNNEDLVERATRLLDHLQELQQEIPLQSPESAFARLQPLRDLIFWLPSTILRAGEPDLAPLILLSHLYASALTVEPLFPEIGGAYLGTMVIFPLERIYDILRQRAMTQSHDSGCQVALSLMEEPMQAVAAYKTRQLQAIPSMEAYRMSPQPSGYGLSQTQLRSNSEVASTARYSASPIPSPQSLSVPSTSYFTAVPSTASGNRHDSSHVRPQPVMERHLSADNARAMQMVYPSQQPRSSHEVSSRMDYFGQVPYHSYGSPNLNTRDMDSNSSSTPW